MADAWDRFKDFTSCVRKEDQPIADFIAEWDNCYHRLRKVNCEYTDTVLGFKLLEDARLKEVETKLVLTGVNYDEVKSKKNLKEQVVNSMKKFTGRAVLANDNSNRAVGVKEEPTWIAEVEEVLLAQGWKPPAKEGRRRSRSASPPARREKGKYKGRKNILGRDGKPLKCYTCKCDHEDNCNCPCVYHLANACPKTRAPDLGLFMSTNVLPNLDNSEFIL